MNTAVKPLSQLVLDSNALFKQFSLSVRKPNPLPDFPLKTLSQDLRQCLYLIRSTPGISTDEGLILSTQAEAYSRQLNNLVATDQPDEAAGSVLQVISDFCDLIQRELGARTQPAPGRCVTNND